MNRREFALLTGGMAVEQALRLADPGQAEAASKADLQIRIAPVSVELAPGRTIRTAAYNGAIPGPILRMREGKKIIVDIFNDTDIPELVHWHGQAVPEEPMAPKRKAAHMFRRTGTCASTSRPGRPERAGITRTLWPWTI